MAQRSNTPQDRQLGAQLRLQRRMSGFSQDALASQLGVSYQQLQKYETGENRISAVRLGQIARFLQVPVTVFYDQNQPDTPACVAPKLCENDARFLLAYSALERSLRVHVRAMVEALEQGQKNGEAPNDAPPK